MQVAVVTLFPSGATAVFVVQNAVEMHAAFWKRVIGQQTVFDEYFERSCSAHSVLANTKNLAFLFNLFERLLIVTGSGIFLLICQALLRIGDCLAARTAEEAIYEGLKVAASL